MKDIITLAHGSGGTYSHQLIKELFLKYFDNAYLHPLTDAADLGAPDAEICFTTDSHVVQPLFYPGGDIGRLAVAGTVNDLAVSGADALWLSCSLIIEAGFQVKDLERIVRSMKRTADECGVTIVTGDTKVVSKGEADGLFINTAGIGKKHQNRKLGLDRIKPGDRVIINGYIGDHGAAILNARRDFPLKADIRSDCRPLNKIIRSLLDEFDDIKMMRDPTRGGVATSLNEFVDQRPFGIVIDEDALPLRESVEGLCEPLGFDPLYLANEGKFIAIMADKSAPQAVDYLKNKHACEPAAVIGEVVDDPAGRVLLKTRIGSHRVLDMLSGEMLPRIC